MIEYSEKLSPTFGLYAIAFLAIPFFTLTLAPFNVALGVALGIVVFAALSCAMYLSAPRIVVTATTLQAGKATIERTFIGAVSTFGGDAARAERGVNLDARAWTLFRGYIAPVVKIELTDASDPTPYWLISTREPQKLAGVLRVSGRRSSIDESDSGTTRSAE